MSAQLEGSDMGTIKLIEHIVIDKVGVYAYPLEDASRRLTIEGKVSFCNAVDCGRTPGATHQADQCADTI